ncbi:hypothetical protein CE91St38_08890 [Desulfovibrionaceae bacterium]|nr:hypothetical protein CE91St38_08890 [Desulfovibrionaceae bacterium]GKI11433.1 hypothetical protein CE91St39_08870 [Desulfovibrionaceae bacterium]
MDATRVWGRSGSRDGPWARQAARQRQKASRKKRARPACWGVRGTARRAGLKRAAKFLMSCPAPAEENLRRGLM